MQIIYQPKGGALEYAPLALNIYQGCTHQCEYCFGPAATRKGRSNYLTGANPKANFIQRLEYDAKKLSEAGVQDEILMSFIGDPYQPAEMNLGLTRQAIELLIRYNLRFTILTKGGTRAKRDFDLLGGYDKCRFGTSLVFMDQGLASLYEPGAARRH